MQALIWIALVGVVVYLVETYLPMAPPFKLVFRIVAVVVALYMLMSVIGAPPGFRGDVRDDRSLAVPGALAPTPGIAGRALGIDVRAALTYL